jgi:hypothetical protein
MAADAAPTPQQVRRRFAFACKDLDVIGRSAIGSLSGEDELSF